MIKTILFVTSSREKFAQAKFAFKSHDVEVKRQPWYGRAYTEPRSLDQAEITNSSYEDLIRRLHKNGITLDDKIIIFEDTSVRIEALSDEFQDYPGTDIKYWIKDRSFDNIQRELDEKGGDKRCSVKSTITLIKSKQVPISSNYIEFTGETSGVISSIDFNLQTKPLYPWLSSKTFNKWFIPAGANVPISKMDIDEDIVYDFRFKSFNKLIDYLESNRIIQRRHNTLSQQKLFKTRLVYLVSGYSCSGKTTFAEKLVDAFDFYHLEASDYMTKSYYEVHGFKSDVSIKDYVKVVLKENPGIVANQIINLLNKESIGRIVVTGFRNIQEAKIIQEHLNKDSFIELVFLNANAKVRYDRSLKRNRTDKSKTFEEFLDNDKFQAQIGLAEFFLSATENRCILNNEGDLPSYYKQIENLIVSKNIEIIKPGILKHKNELIYRSIIALGLLMQEDSEKEGFTTTDIARRINQINSTQSSSVVNKNNISRLFNQSLYPYFEVAIKDKIYYILSSTGKCLFKKLTNAN